MKKGIFDTHAHYNDKKFEGEGEKLISFVHENGVDYICNVGANIEESIESIELAKKFDYIFDVNDRMKTVQNKTVQEREERT